MGFKVDSVWVLNFHNQKRKHTTTNKIPAEILESITIQHTKRDCDGNRTISKKIFNTDRFWGRRSFSYKLAPSN